MGEAGKARLKATQKSVRDGFRVRLFNKSLWKIESYYGAVVVSFFKFLKWTIVLNFVSSLFVLGLILVPQKLEDASGDASNPSNYSDDAVCGFSGDDWQAI